MAEAENRAAWLAEEDAALRRVLQVALNPAQASAAPGVVELPGLAQVRVPPLTPPALPRPAAPWSWGRKAGCAWGWESPHPAP